MNEAYEFAHPARGADLVRALRAVRHPVQGGARLPAHPVAATRFPGASQSRGAAASGPRAAPRRPALRPPATGHFEWLRHRVEPWLPSHAGSHDGLFAVRTVDVDEEAEDLEDAVEWLNDHTRDTEPAAELVLGDLVVPFLSPFWLPVPRHLTVGIRRNVLDPGSKSEVFAFERAPVHLLLGEDPKLAFNVESFFYRSQPAADIRRGPRADVQCGARLRGRPGAAQHAFEVGLEEDYTIVVGYKRDF